MSTATLRSPTRRPLPRDHQSNVLPLATRGPSAGDQEEVVAEVTEVIPPGRFLDDPNELEELVVERVGGRAGIVDEDLDPGHAGVPQDGRAVRPRHDEVPRALTDDRQRPVAVVGHAQVLGGGRERDYEGVA